jgi:hypothetical protein
VIYPTKILYFKTSPCSDIVFFLLGDSPASEFYVPTFRNIPSVPEDRTVSVPKRRHLKFRRRLITQKKRYKTSTHLRKEANQTIIVMNCHYSLPHVSSTTTFTYRHCFAGGFSLNLSLQLTHYSSLKIMHMYYCTIHLCHRVIALCIKQFASK